MLKAFSAGTYGLGSLNGTPRKRSTVPQDVVIEAEKKVIEALTKLGPNHAYITTKRMMELVPESKVRICVRRRLRLKLPTMLHTGQEGHLLQNLYGAWYGL